MRKSSKSSNVVVEEVTLDARFPDTIKSDNKTPILKRGVQLFAKRFNGYLKIRMLLKTSSFLNLVDIPFLTFKYISSDTRVYKAISPNENEPTNYKKYTDFRTSVENLRKFAKSSVDDIRMANKQPEYVNGQIQAYNCTENILLLDLSDSTNIVNLKIIWDIFCTKMFNFTEFYGLKIVSNDPNMMTFSKLFPLMLDIALGFGTTSQDQIDLLKKFQSFLKNGKEGIKFKTQYKFNDDGFNYLIQDLINRQIPTIRDNEFKESLTTFRRIKNRIIESFISDCLALLFRVDQNEGKNFSYDETNKVIFPGGFVIGEVQTFQNELTRGEFYISNSNEDLKLDLIININYDIKKIDENFNSVVDSFKIAFESLVKIDTKSDPIINAIYNKIQTETAKYITAINIIQNDFKQSLKSDFLKRLGVSFNEQVNFQPIAIELELERGKEPAISASEMTNRHGRLSILISLIKRLKETTEGVITFSIANVIYPKFQEFLKLLNSNKELMTNEMDEDVNNEIQKKITNELEIIIKNTVSMLNQWLDSNSYNKTLNQITQLWIDERNVITKSISDLTIKWAKVFKMINSKREEKGEENDNKNESKETISKDIKMMISKLRSSIEFKKPAIIREKGQYESNVFIATFKSKLNTIEKNSSQIINQKDSKQEENQLIGILKNYSKMLKELENELDGITRNDALKRSENSSNSSNSSSSSSKRPNENPGEKPKRRKLETGDYQSSCKICSKPTFMREIKKFTPICSNSCLDKFLD